MVDTDSNGEENGQHSDEERTTLVDRLRSAGRGARTVGHHLWPAAVPIGATGLYAVFRDQIAEAINDYVPDTRIGLGQDDQGKNLPDTIENIEDLNTNMPTERKLGELDVKYDVETPLQEALAVMRAVSADYNSGKARLDRAKDTLRDYSIRMPVTLGDLLVEQVEKIPGMKKVVGQIAELNNWDAYQTVRNSGIRRLHGDKLVEKLDSMKSKGMKFEDAMAELRGEASSDTISLSGTKKRTIDNYMKWSGSIMKTHKGQVAMAELTEGYGNVIESALREYQDKRDPAALRTINEYLTKHKANTLKVLERDMARNTQEYKEVKTLLNDLEGLAKNVSNRAETLKGIKNIYFKLGDLRSKYKTVGTYFTQETQDKVIGGIEAQLAKTSERIGKLDSELAGEMGKVNKEVKKAQDDEAYMVENPDPGRLFGPSPLAYNVADVGGVLVVGALAYVGAKTYFMRGVKGLKNKVTEGVAKLINRNREDN